MSENNRIAYLSHDGLTDPLGQSQILPYILGLEEKGYTFTIFSFEKPEVFQSNKEVIDGLITGKKIRWVPLPYHRKPAVLATLLDLYKLWKAVKHEHRQQGFAIIHCRSYITSLIGLKMKRQFKTKFIFDMRGFWADERVEGGLWNLSNPIYNFIYRYFKKKEKKFLTEANHIISLTENGKREIESWKIKSAPITVIPTCVDLALFDPAKIKAEDKTRLRKKLGIHENDFVLLYLGSWGTWYMTEEMLNFFSELKKQKTKAKFLVVSNDQIDLNNYLHKHDVILTSANRKSIPLYISLASASIFFIKPSYSKKASFATKMSEVIAMDVPFITNSGWGDVDILGNKFFGQVLNDISHHGIAEYFKLPNNLKKPDDSQTSKIELSLDFGLDAYARVYQSTMASPSFEAPKQ